MLICLVMTTSGETFLLGIHSKLVLVLVHRQGLYCAWIFTISYGKTMAAMPTGNRDNQRQQTRS